MKIQKAWPQPTAASIQQFGVSQTQREALYRRYQDAVAMFGTEGANTLMELARLCIGYGMKKQFVASPPMLWSAVQHFAEREETLACPHANREGALAMSALAFLLLGDGQAEQAVVFAGTAYGILAKEKTVHVVDLARAAHVGALCWSCKGSLKDANAALKSASEHMKRVSRKTYPDIFDEHVWLRHVVTTHTAAERSSMTR